MQQELRWALEKGKQVITVYEADETSPGFFDYDKARLKYKDTEWESVLELPPVGFLREGLSKLMLEKTVAASPDAPAYVPSRPLVAATIQFDIIDRSLRPSLSPSLSPSPSLALARA